MARFLLSLLLPQAPGRRFLLGNAEQDHLAVAALLSRGVQQGSAIPTFDPLTVRRVEPTLAWFTEAELAHWRAKLIEGKQIIRRRRAHHPDAPPYLLDGILYCGECSTPDDPVHMVCAGIQPTTGNRLINMYECSRKKRKQCGPSVSQHMAFAALTDQLATIQTRTSDIVTRIHILVAGGGSAGLARWSPKPT